MTGWTTYMVRCSDGSLYTGVTTDIRRRLNQHNGVAPGGARYTRTRRPVMLVYSRTYLGKGARSAALRREAAIKALPKWAKEKQVENHVC